MSTLFKVKGPYKVPATKLPGGKFIRAEDGTEFWKKKAPGKQAHRYGCYIFAMSTGPGVVPMYVGQTVKSFKKECFQNHKLLIYNEALRSFKIGKPVLFFIVAPEKKGKNNARAVTRVETFLIQEAKARNPKLLNKQKVKPPSWGIQGVIRGNQGKPSSATTALRKMLRL